MLYKVLLLILTAVASAAYSMEPESNQFESKTKKQKIEEVTLVSDNGQEFKLSVSAAQRSETIKNLLADIAQSQWSVKDSDSVSSQIPLNIESSILSKIIEALTALDAVYDQIGTPEYQQKLKQNVQPYLISFGEESLKILDAVSYLDISALTPLLLNDIAEQIYNSKDLNLIAPILEKINYNGLKDLQPIFKSNLINLNRQLYYKLFLTHLKSIAAIPFDPAYSLPAQGIAKLGTSNDLKQVIIVYNNNIRFFDFSSKKKQADVKQFTHNTDDVPIAFSADLRYLLVSTQKSKQVYLLDLSTEPIRYIKNFHYGAADDNLLRPSSAAFSSGTLFMAYDFNNNIFCYSMEGLSQKDEQFNIDVRKLPQRFGNAGCRVSWKDRMKAKANHLFFAGVDEEEEDCNAVAINDLVTEQHEFLSTDHPLAVDFAISNDAKIALTLTANGKAIVWDLTKVTPVVRPAYELSAKGLVKAIALDHEGKFALTSAANGNFLLNGILLLSELSSTCDRAVSLIQLPKQFEVLNLAFDSKNNYPIILLSNNGNPVRYSFDDFAEKFSIAQLVLFCKLEQFKAENPFSKINQCPYFKDLYCNSPADIKKAADEIFTSGQH